MKWENIKKYIEGIGFLGLIAMAYTAFGLYRDVEDLKKNIMTEEKSRIIAREEIEKENNKRELEYLKDYLFRHGEN